MFWNAIRGSLRELELSKCQWSPEGLSTVLRQCPRLEILKFGKKFSEHDFHVTVIDRALHVQPRRTASARSVLAQNTPDLLRFQPLQTQKYRRGTCLVTYSGNSISPTTLESLKYVFPQGATTGTRSLGVIGCMLPPQKGLDYPECADSLFRMLSSVPCRKWLWCRCR